MSDAPPALTSAQGAVLARCFHIDSGELQRRVLRGDEGGHLAEIIDALDAYFAASRVALGHDRVPIVTWETYVMIKQRRTLIQARSDNPAANIVKTTTKTCSNNTPAGFTGHWRDWHRGHGCDKDDGKPRSEAGTTEIAQLEVNKDTGYLTDAQLSYLRASTTSGNTLLVRALDELRERRAAEKKHAPTPFNHSSRTSKHFEPFDHSTRTTKHFEPLLGYCVCDHCARLPAHEAQVKEVP